MDVRSEEDEFGPTVVIREGQVGLVEADFQKGVLRIYQKTPIPLHLVQELLDAAEKLAAAHSEPPRDRLSTNPDVPHPSSTENPTPE